MANPLQAHAATAWFAALLLAPLALAIPKGGLVLLVALLLLLVGTRPTSQPEYGLAARIALWIPVAMLAWHVLVTLLQDQSLRNVGAPFRLIFLPLVAYVAATRPLSATALGWGFLLLVVVQVAVMAWQFAFEPYIADVLRRATGTTGRAIISAAFAWIAALGAFVLLRRVALPPATLRLIRYAAILLGVAAIAMAAARGVAAAVPLSFFLLALLLRRARIAWLGIGAFMLLLLLPGVLGERALSGFASELAELKRGNAETSLGFRTQMWGVALGQFAANPWTGAGAQAYKSAMLAKLASGDVSGGAAVWGEPHNDYLMFAAFFGLPSLALFLAFMGFLLAAFIQVARQARDSERGDAATAGAAIVVCYLVTCATSSFFAAQSSTTFFVFFVGLLLGISYRAAPAVAPRNVAAGAAAT
jgi:O-antigen ligase